MTMRSRARIVRRGWDIFESLRGPAPAPAPVDKACACGAAGPGDAECPCCGTVIGRDLDMGAEWRFHGAEEAARGVSDPCRCGPPPSKLLPGTGVGSSIGRTQGGSEHPEMRLVRMHHSWASLTHRQRTMCSMYDSIYVRALGAGIPANIVEEAKALYKTAAERSACRGANRLGLVAACLYMACKLHCVPRSTKEVAEMFELPVATLARGCRIFDGIMPALRLPETSAADLVVRFCNRLHLDPAVCEACRSVLQAAESLGVLQECTPPTLAAAAISYCAAAAGAPLDRKQLAAVCGISHVTVSKCRRRLDAEQARLGAK